MKEDKRRYVFYEYLLFFWKKKIWFIILPVILILLAIGLSAFQKVTYSGNSTVYIGDVKISELTKPDVLAGYYIDEKEENGTNSNITAVTGKITFHVNGEKKTNVENRLNELTDKYIKEMMAKYDELLSLEKEKVRLYSEQVEKKSARVKELQDFSLSLEGLEGQRYQYMIDNLDGLISDYEEKLILAQYEVKNFEEPKVIKKEVTENKESTSSNVIIALLGGLFLSLVLLTFWKYIEDARRYSDVR
ncbi:MAG TPA: hypothetical protein VNR61_00235 [Niallia sp.]|nr:hypothetical protein [Niallia sp.]